MAEMQLDGAAAGVVAPRIQNDGNNQRSKALPVSVHIVDGHGYVWDADDARRLRQDHRIVGAMIGAVAGFKQQNAASGLPLRLLPEELGLALDRGWARGYRLRGESGGKCGEGNGGITIAAGAADPFLGEDGGEVKGGGGDGGGSEKRQEDSSPSSPSSSSWRAALAQGTHFALSTAAPESLRVYLDETDGGEASFKRPKPGSRAAASHAVFRDLHQRGYCLTPGANFGAHWLAYPSDPMLYHAQLCVRVCCSDGAEEDDEDEDEGEETRKNDDGDCNNKPVSASASSAPLCPTLLAAASRGAHAARKHLLLAYPSGKKWRGEERVRYLTIAPEAGFGS